MTFGELMNGLFKVKEMFPSSDMTPSVVTYGTSTVTITIPVTDENAKLLLDAVRMFSPREEEEYTHPWYPDEPPF